MAEIDSEKNVIISSIADQISARQCPATDLPDKHVSKCVSSVIQFQEDIL